MQTCLVNNAFPVVIPAKAGIQVLRNMLGLDSRFRGNDRIGLDSASFTKL